MGHFLQVVQEESHNHEVPDPRISCLIRARCPSEQLLRPDQGLRSSGVHLLHRLLRRLEEQRYPRLTDSATEYDGVCATAALAYMNSFADGNDEATSTLYAAKAFYEEYAKGKSASSESTCVKAALGYAGKSSDQDPSRTAAMLTFINKSIESGEKIADPVCAAATLAYLDAKIAKK